MFPTSVTFVLFSSRFFHFSALGIFAWYNSGGDFGQSDVIIHKDSWEPRSGESTKHGPGMHGPPPWTGSMDRVPSKYGPWSMDPFHGPGPWTSYHGPGPWTPSFRNKNKISKLKKKLIHGVISN